MQAVICYYTLAFGLNPEIFSKVAKLLAILVAKKLKPSSVPANFTKRLTKSFSIEQTAYSRPHSIRRY